MKRAILLVLDGLGIGAMQDVAATRPQDARANTLGCILRHKPGLAIPTLANMGLLNSLERKNTGSPGTIASWGWCQLAYQGADSYLGHQEIMGAIPLDPQKTLVSEKIDEFEKILKDQGYSVSRPLPGKPLLCVDNAIVIADNIEADAGQNINLTVCTDLVDFNDAVVVGNIIRAAVQVARVIVFGGPGLTLSKILDHVEEHEGSQVGINSPALGVYNENLFVKHMGFGVNPELQAASIFARAKLDVFLDGKMADLIECRSALRNPLVETHKLLDCIKTQFASMTCGMIAATVQETDLAAHGAEIDRFAGILETVDAFLAGFLPAMQPGDLLIITADHGNDPGLGSGMHTRETTPLLVYSPGMSVVPLGGRDSLADVGASLVDYFNLPRTQDGKSFIAEWKRGKNEF